MMLDETLLSNPGADLSEHPAIVAWKEVTPGGEDVSHVEVLEEGRGNKRLTKPAVYRLLFGDQREAVIAKKCRTVTAQKERLLYDDLLPQLPLCSLRCFGTLERGEGRFSWLFMEDAGSRSPNLDIHGALVGTWLGRMHTAASDVREVRRLPAHGPGFYLKRLQSAAEKIRRHLTNTALREEDVALLRTIITQTENIARAWDSVEEGFGPALYTLVHGDFVAKNMRIVTSDEKEILVFDWSTGAFGPPAVDVGALLFDSQSADWTAPAMDFEESLEAPGLDFLTAYWSVVRHKWPDVDFPTVVGFARVGTLLRCIVAVEWAAEGLAYEWVDRTMRRMQFYSRRLAGFTGV